MNRLTKKGISASGIYKTCCTQFRNDECNLLQGDCSQCSYNEKVWNALAEYENLELVPEQIEAQLGLLNGFRKYVSEPCEINGLLNDGKNLIKAQNDLSSLMEHFTKLRNKYDELHKLKQPNDLFTKIAELPTCCEQCKHSKGYGCVGDRYCKILRDYFTGNVKSPYKERPDECPINSYNDIINQRNKFKEMIVENVPCWACQYEDTCENNNSNGCTNGEFELKL